MQRLNLGWEQLRAANPRLIYASSSGFGSSGPNRDFPAMDLTVQAMSGVMSVTGFPDRPPVKAGPALCDFLAGIHLYGAIATALYEREKTQRGRRVEVSMQEAVYASLASNLGLYFGAGGHAPLRTGNSHGGLAESPYNVYPTVDGWIAILCAGEEQWRALTRVMGRPELAQDPRFADLKARVAHLEEVDELVANFSRPQHKGPLFQRLMAEHIPCAPVRDLDEVVHDEHLHERGFLSWIDHPTLGRIVVPNSPLRFFDTPLTSHVPSRELGADNDSVYGKWLGLAPESVAELKKNGVI
jgi:formyl-CoA transferase